MELSETEKDDGNLSSSSKPTFEEIFLLKFTDGYKEHESSRNSNKSNLYSSEEKYSRTERKRSDRKRSDRARSERINFK